MSAEGISRAMSRVEEIQSKISGLVGRSAPAESFNSLLTEAARGDVPAELRPMIGQIAARYNLPPRLIESVARQESAFNPRAVSPMGAQGIMQLMPSTQRDLGVTNPFDPAQSLDGGARYLRMMLDRFGGDLTKALAAYNAGPQRVEQYHGVPPFAETQGYVTRILSDLETE